MGKLKVLSGKEVCQHLKAHGFQEVRRKGSHIIMQKQVDDSTITVPVPNHQELKIGTLMSIIRQSGIVRTEFEQ
ncbi:periplasmic or secreted lipoprotein [Achromatium sp. WMS3]|nr:periplasmic or secreted lipoprotein [Achromatium sp. WMS3]